MLVRLIKLSVLVLGCTTFLGCAPPPPAEVHQRDTLSTRAEVDKMGGNLIRYVQPGDTMFGIAFAYSLDVNKVAAWNYLQDTSKLKVGQKIRLTKPIGFKEKQAIVQTVVIETNDTSKPLPTSPSLKAEPLPSPSEKPTSVQTRTKTKSTTQKQPTPQVADVPQRKPLPSVISAAWVWPSQGSVVSYFSTARGKQGVDIDGKRGDRVVASQDGEVVYAGNGLKGYGNLLIIKHNDKFLSAYAHNDELFVSEGQYVTKNSRIASMGVDKSQRGVLHFQIRENGKPVNPMRYLPKRGWNKL